MYILVSSYATCHVPVTGTQPQTTAGRPGGPNHGDSHGGHSAGHRRLKYQHNKDDTYGDDELHRLWISVSWQPGKDLKKGP